MPDIEIDIATEGIDISLESYDIHPDEFKQFTSECDTYNREKNLADDMKFGIDSSGKMTKGGEIITTEYNGSQKPVLETLGDEIKDQTEKKSSNDADTARKIADKYLNGIYGDNIAEPLRDATTQKIQDKIEAERNSKTFPDTIANADANTIADEIKNGTMNTPDSKTNEVINKYFSSRSVDPETEISKDDINNSLDRMAKSKDAKLAQTAKDAKQVIEEKGFFEKYSSVLWLGLITFLLGELGTASGNKNSGCIATSSSKSSLTSQTTSQNCKIFPFTCDADLAKSGSGCSGITCNKTDPRIADCTAALAGTTPCATTIDSNTGFLGKKTQCSVFCSNDHLSTQIGTTSYTYNCTYCDLVCGIQGIFQLIAGIADDVINDTAGLFGDLSSILKYGLWGVLIIFICWIIYKVLSSGGGTLTIKNEK